MVKIENILREYLEIVLDDLNYKPRDVVVKPISSEGANYTSGLFKVIVTSPGKEKLHLFSKVASGGETMRKQMGSADLFLRERVVYEDLQKAYDNLQTKYRIPEEDRFLFTKYYGSNINTGSEVFIFEDLNAKGFQIYDRFDTLNWNHAAETIKVLARFHALSLALEKENPEVFRKFTKNVYRINNVSNMAKGRLEYYLSGLSENHKNLIRKFFKKSGDMEYFIQEHYKPYGKYMIVHSDYRPSNIMFKQEGEKVTVIAVDFQTVRIGCAVSDILYFVLTATDGEFRRNHFEQLMDLYHEQLSTRLAAMDIDVNDVYPRKQFDEELEKMLPTLLPMAMAMYPVLLVSPDDAPQISGDSNVDNFVVRPTQKSIARLSEMVEDFIRWKLL